MTAPEESIADYDSIQLPRWRARARNAGVRLNPGGDRHESTFTKARWASIAAGTGICTARFAAPRRCKSHPDHLRPIEIP